MNDHLSTPRDRRHRAVPLLVAGGFIAGGVGVASASASAQTAPTSSYVVLLGDAPVATYDGEQPGLAPTMVDAGERLDATSEPVQDYVQFLDEEQLDVLDRVGIDDSARGQVYTYALNGFEAELTPQQAIDLANQPDVMSVSPNEYRQLETYNTPSFLGIDQPGAAWDIGYTGTDVVIGVIDTGIWPEHESFADDGSYAPLDGFADLPCEFGNAAYNPDDAPFECNNKLLGARDMRTKYIEEVGPETFYSARDYNGHGTHVAGTAAGNAVMGDVGGFELGELSGVAPDARVIAYSACGDWGCVVSDLLEAIDTAVADGVDVINYSIGGEPSLNGPDDIAFLNAAAANVWTATSAGNSGPGGGTVGGPATVPWVTSVGASTHDRSFVSTASLGDGTSVSGASITAGTPSRLPLVDAADFGNELCNPAVRFDPGIEDAIVLCWRGEIARVDKSLAVAQQGGAGMILANVADGDTLDIDAHMIPSVHVDAESGIHVADYIAAAGDDAVALLGDAAPAPSQGSVMAGFSSRGENDAAPDIIKPDITAPGVNIMAGTSPFQSIGPAGELYSPMSGTSMSSPHVAGVFAVLREANPDWTAAMAKSAVMTTARQDVTKEDAATQADPFDMGAGHIDPSGSPSADGSLFNPGLVYDADYTDYRAFLCEAAPGTFPDDWATCNWLIDLGYSTSPTDLNVPSIGVSSVDGPVTVQRAVTSVADETLTFDAVVDAPQGYLVDVSPSQIELAPGESATFDIEITPPRGQSGDWQFGSLSWVSGDFDVSSPIAVRAV
ncbi:MAG: S8 family serine peptidase [Actinomycetota bacterium]